MSLSGPLRLAVDLRELRGTGTGIGRWVKNFIAARNALAPSVDIVGFGSHCDGIETALSGPILPWNGANLNDLLEQENIGLWLSPYYKIPPGLSVSAIAVVHDVIPAAIFPRKYYFSLQLRHTLWAAWRVATVSDETRRILLDDYGYDSEKIIMARNAVDRRLSPEPLRDDDRELLALGLSSRGFYLAVLDDRPHKNLETLIEVFRLEPSRTLVVVGSERSDFPHNVRALGRIRDEKLFPLYRHAKALLHPALEEGFGLPPLEAMASGTPVILSDIPILREVAGDAARYVPARSVDAWREAIAAVAPIGNEISASTRFRIEETYRALWDCVAARLSAKR